MSSTRRGKSPSTRRRNRSAPEQNAPATAAAPGLSPLWAPVALAFGLAALTFTPRIGGNASLTVSFMGAAVVLLVWAAALFLRLREASEGRSLVRAELRPQHSIQAAVQLSVFAYWGWFWEPVYNYALLLVAQLVFAYAFDMLLTWSRRESYRLGFGPFPIIFSINLFLWFRDDWFYLQFLMVAAGFLGKELIRWQREGKTTHIFNPSAFALGLFAAILIVTGTTGLTWGPEMAASLGGVPRIYLFLFLTGLIVMYFFSITLLTAAAAATLFGLSALYSATTGVPYFIDSEIPAAVFLGMHLLITDPSTSPRSASGKAMFGALYGLGVFVLYAGLGAVGAPTFYDKLLAVPLLNLSVRGIDGLIRSARLPALPGLSSPALTPRGANLAHMGIWIVFFAAMTGMGRTDGPHTGDRVPFWQQACEDGRRGACERLLQIQYSYCGDNSGWACNAIGRQLLEGRGTAPDPELAHGYFARACELRFQPGCLNLLDPGSLADAAPRILDLRLLLRERGPNLMEVPEPELFAKACEHGWGFACEDSGTGIQGFR
jgi:hypothetical protein